MKRVWQVIIVIVLLGTGIFVYSNVRARQQAESLQDLQTETAARGKLTASIGATGTVRANQTAILAWQTTGAVDTVAVEIGDEVEAGTLIADLKQSSLPQTVILAQADLVSARKQLEDLLESQLPKAQALQAMEDAQNALDDYAQNLALRRADAQLALLAAQDALEEAERKRGNMERPRASESTIEQAEARYQLAQNDYEAAKDAFDRVSSRPADDPVRAAALAALSEAERLRNSALSSVNWYKGEWTDEDIAEADANVAQAQANLDKAQREWERLNGERESAELSLLEAQLLDAQRTYEAYQEGAPQDEVDAIQARIAAAEATIATASLTAPFPGTVTSISIMPGDQVSPGTVGARIDDLSRLLVDVNVSEIDINRIEAGQSVNLSFDAIPGKTYTGRVSQVASVGDIVQGVVNFSVTVELIDPDEDVKPGMTAAVNIVVEEIENALLVPNRAVRVVEGRRVVFLLNGSSLERAAVELGASSDTYSEVVGGDLQEGDLIVLNPPNVFTNEGPGFMR